MESAKTLDAKELKEEVSGLGLDVKVMDLDDGGWDDVTTAPIDDEDALKPFESNNLAIGSVDYNPKEDKMCIITHGFVVPGLNDPLNQQRVLIGRCHSKMPQKCAAADCGFVVMKYFPSVERLMADGVLHLHDGMSVEEVAEEMARNDPLYAYAVELHEARPHLTIMQHKTFEPFLLANGIHKDEKTYCQPKVRKLIDAFNADLQRDYDESEAERKHCLATFQDPEEISKARLEDAAIKASKDFTMEILNPEELVAREVEALRKERAKEGAAAAETEDSTAIGDDDGGGAAPSTRDILALAAAQSNRSSKAARESIQVPEYLRDKAHPKSLLVIIDDEEGKKSLDADADAEGTDYEPVVVFMNPLPAEADEEKHWARLAPYTKRFKIWDSINGEWDSVRNILETKNPKEREKSKLQRGFNLLRKQVREQQEQQNEMVRNLALQKLSREEARKEVSGVEESKEDRSGDGGGDCGISAEEARKTFGL